MPFDLSGLLRLRRLKEDQAKGEVSRSRSRASDLAAERHQLLDTLSDRGHDAPGVRGILAIAAARASTSSLLADLEAMEIAQARHVAEAEAVYYAAHRDTKTIEKLEERHDEAERAKELRDEQSVLDELAARTRKRFSLPEPEVDE
jgi:flagellar FliJ protein